MAGRNQEAKWLAKWRRDGMPEWRQHFIRAGRYSHRDMCLECGSTGIGGLDCPLPWQIGCLIGHQTCDRCGAKARNAGPHKQCKLHHETCCQHLDTNHGRLRARLDATALVSIP
jgi:rRNA maturation protein Nop10